MNTHLKFDSAGLRFGMALEAKATAQGEIEGLASTFGGDVDSYGDIVAPGAFSASLKQHADEGTSPVLLWGHDVTRIVGRWERLEERADGLHVAGRLNLKTDGGREAFEHLRAGDLSGLSIGFRVANNGATLDHQTGIRTLTEIELHEISLTALPANRRARVTSVKSLGSVDELRTLLRSQGLPHRAADKIAAGGWAALGGRSLEDVEAEQRKTDEVKQMSILARELRVFAKGL